MQRVAIALAAVVLGGCVAQPVYQWGDYEDKLYAGYKDQTKMEELKLDLEKHIANMDASSQKVAPGLFAELGTLYLQSGDAEKAKVLYVRERNTWPESKTLMNALIQNLDRRSQAQAPSQEERSK